MKGRFFFINGLLCLLLSSISAADILILKDGSRVDIGQDHWREKGKIFFRRFGGTVGIEKGDVFRIEKTAPQKPEETRPKEAVFKLEGPQRDVSKDKGERGLDGNLLKINDYLNKAIDFGERVKSLLTSIEDAEPSSEEDDNLASRRNDLEALKLEVDELNQRQRELLSFQRPIAKEVQGNLEDSLDRILEAIELGQSAVEEADRSQLERGLSLIDEAQSILDRGLIRVKASLEGE